MLDRSPPLTPLTPSSPLVLGSGSPRRREILSRAGVPFLVVVGDANEDVLAGEPAGDYLTRVVVAKLAAVRARVRETKEAAGATAVLVADTSVVEGGDILGKPGSEGEALAMIGRLSARTHEVMTRFALGLAFAASDAPPLVARTVVTRVTFRAITPEEARAYAAGGEGRDKAGGYAVQGGAAPFVARIDGSYSNVVGLPEDEVREALRSLGLFAAAPRAKP